MEPREVACTACNAQPGKRCRLVKLDPINPPLASEGFAHEVRREAARLASREQLQRRKRS